MVGTILLLVAAAGTLWAAGALLYASTGRIADEGAAERRAIGAAHIRSIGQETDMDRDALASRYRYRVIDGKPVFLGVWGEDAPPAGREEGEEQ